MLSKGHIQLHRSILEWEWYSDLNTHRLFTHLLLTVNYEDKQWHGVTIRRGQRLASLEKLSQETGLSVQNIRTSVKRLISTGELTSNQHGKNRIITVINYDKFQQPTGKLTASQQGTNNNVIKQEDNKEVLTTTTTTARALTYYLDKINPTASERVIALIKHYEDELSAAVVKRAIDNALDEKKTGWSYIESILRRYKADNIRCIADADKSDEQWKSRKTERGECRDDINRLESQRKMRGAEKTPSSQPRNSKPIGGAVAGERERKAVEDMRKELRRLKADG